MATRELGRKGEKIWSEGALAKGLCNIAVAKEMIHRGETELNKMGRLGIIVGGKED